jgi:hypothetical protein
MCLLRAIKTLAQNHQYSIPIKVKQENDVPTFQNVTLVYILDRCLINPNMRIIANKTDLHKSKIAKCYLLAKIGKLHHNCEAIVQALNDMEGLSLFDNIAMLRSRLNEQVEIPFKKGRVAAFEHFGYHRMAETMSEDQKAELLRKLMCSNGLLLTFNGNSLISPLTCFNECRENAQQALQMIQDKKQLLQPENFQQYKEQGLQRKNFRPGVDFESEIFRGIDVDSIERTVTKFEYGFRCFIMSTLCYLQKHHEKELSVLRVNTLKYNQLLYQGIANPLDWRSLKMLLSHINLLLYKIIKETAIKETSK